MCACACACVCMCVCVCVRPCWCCSQTDFGLSVLIRIMTVGPGRCPNFERGIVGGGRGSASKESFNGLGGWAAGECCLMGSHFTHWQQPLHPPLQHAHTHPHTHTHTHTHKHTPTHTHPSSNVCYKQTKTVTNIYVPANTDQHKLWSTQRQTYHKIGGRFPQTTIIWRIVTGTRLMLPSLSEGA